MKTKKLIELSWVRYALSVVMTGSFIGFWFAPELEIFAVILIFSWTFTILSILIPVREKTGEIIVIAGIGKERSYEIDRRPHINMSPEDTMMWANGLHDAHEHLRVYRDEIEEAEDRMFARRYKEWEDKKKSKHENGNQTKLLPEHRKPD